MEKEGERFDQIPVDTGGIPCALLWDTALDGYLFPNSKVRYLGFRTTLLKGHDFENVFLLHMSLMSQNWE